MSSANRDARALDRDLTDFYEQEVERELRRQVRPDRIGRRDEFIRVLRAEQRVGVIDVGAGPGLDTVAFAEAGFATVGLDLAPGNAAAMHDRGLYGVCGSLYDPPFADATFDAVWTMSTFVHVPDDRVDEALASVVALAKPGAPVAIGTWGGFDREGVHEFGEIRPYRFFSLRTHERWVATLARHASVETFDTRRPDPKIDWEYQFAIVRRR